MIIRNNKINRTTAFVKFTVSYGLPDIKKWMRQYIDCITLHDPTLLLRAKEEVFSEHDVRYYLEHTPNIFANFDNPWKEQLSAWAWYHIVNEKYVIQSATDEHKFLFTEKAFVRPGRPIQK